jgi:hypothetical protein
MRAMISALADRRGDQHQIGIATSCPALAPTRSMIPSSAPASASRLRPKPTTSPTCPACLQRQREGTADQPDAKDDDLAELSGAVHRRPRCRRSQLSSASRKRAFSLSVPIVTRSHSGMP